MLGNERDSWESGIRCAIHFATNKINIGPAEFALDGRSGTGATGQIRCGFQPS